MRKINVGVKIGEDKICILLYADHAVVMSESAEIQRNTKVIGGHGKDFGVRLSSEKSKIIIINRWQNESNTTCRLQGNELRQTQEYKYLGMWQSINGCDRTKNKKISTMNQWEGRLWAVARTKVSKYGVREAWKCVAVPGLMYGVDVIAWNEKWDGEARSGSK